MSSPTNGAPYQSRVMIEIVKDGIPRRVHVWTVDGETLIAFAPNTTEAEATEIVGRGLALIRPLDMAVLFRDHKRRRFIETE